MDDADNLRGFKSGGLPRHSFVEDPFFRDSQRNSNMFREFDDSPNGNARHFGSNPRLFEDDFFEKFSRPFGDSSFFRSSLPRRPMNYEEKFEQPYRQHSVPQRSPSQPPSNTTYSNSSQSEFPGGGPSHHQRQSSSGSAYDNFPSVNRSCSGGPPSSRTQASSQQPEKVHVIPVKHERQPRDHHSSNSNIVEINSAGSNGYTNGQLNPDRRHRVSNTSQAAPNSPPIIPTVHVEDYADGKGENTNVNAISDTPIPLPPPEQLDECVVEKQSKVNSEPAPTEDAPKVTTEPHESTVNDTETNKEEEDNSLTHAIVSAMVQHVDNIERRVEQFRERAAQLEQDKELILDLLGSVNSKNDFMRLDLGDQEDIALRTQHLLKRCSTVNIEVNTPRNEEQTRALAEVNAFIDNVVKDTCNSIAVSRERVQRFLNACSPDEPSGPIDEYFQTRIVECTADDQKKIRRRLTQLIEQMQRTERNCPNVGN